MKKEFTTQQFFIFNVAILILAFILRVSGLTWGLPNAEHWYSYHPDERQIAVAVSNVATDWNPHFFNYPSLFIYLTYFAYLIGNTLGFSTAANGTPWPALHDVLLSGRIVCALLGALTIPAVYLIGRRLSSEKTALFAAFLMAVAPGHVQHSHFATVDVPATFFVAWSLYFAVCGAEEKPTKNILISAFLAGLAAATKYNAGLILFAPLVAIFAGSFERKPLLGLCAFGLALVGFVVGCPHSVLSTGEFLGNRTDSGLLYELLVHPRQGQDNIFTNTGNGWFYHLTFNLPFAFTAPGALCAVVGLFLAARLKNKSWLPILAFAGVYFLTLGLSQVRFMRYLFPLLPVLCLAAPLCFQLLPQALQRRCAVALGVLMFIGATNVLYPFCVSDPRDQAAAYLKKVVTKPVTIALINRPWFYTPPLWPQDHPPPSQITSGVSPDGKFRFEVVGFNAIKAETSSFIIINNLEDREYNRLKNEDLAKFYEELCCNTKNTGLNWFQNHPALELPGRQFVPHDFLYSNPTVTIYRFGR